MIVIFVKRNLSSSDPMLDVRLLKEIIAGTIAAFMTMFAMICFVISFTMVTGCGRTFSF